MDHDPNIKCVAIDYFFSKNLLKNRSVNRFWRGGGGWLGIGSGFFSECLDPDTLKPDPQL